MYSSLHLGSQALHSALNKCAEQVKATLPSPLCRRGTNLWIDIPVASLQSWNKAGFMPPRAGLSLCFSSVSQLTSILVDPRYRDLCGNLFLHRSRALIYHILPFLQFLTVLPLVILYQLHTDPFCLLYFDFTRVLSV